MFGDIAAKKELLAEKGISDYIPYTRHVTDTILGTAAGDLLTVFKLTGRSHLSADYQTLMNWVADLNTVFKGAATDHLSLWTHMVRRRVTEYQEAQYDNAFCAGFDAKYRAMFTDKSLLVNELYLTVVHRAVPDKTLALLARFEKQSVKEKRERQQSAVKDLEELQRLFLASLRRYGPEVLGTYQCVHVATDGIGEDGEPIQEETRLELGEWWNREQSRGAADAADTRTDLVKAEAAAKASGLPVYLYSRPAEFLARLVNGEHLPMPVTYEHFRQTMPQNRINFSSWGELGEIRTPTRTRFFGMVEIFDYEKRSEPGHLNKFLKVPYECVLTQSFSLLSRHAARGQLERHRQHLIDSNDPSDQQVQELTFALDQLMAGEFAFGEHHATLAVFGDTPAETRDRLEKSRALFFDVGIVPQVIGLALEAAYWAQLPCNWQYRPRPAPISSQNFLSFSSLHNYMAGKPTGNPWGSAVTMFKTDAGTPLYFNFHATDPTEDNEGERPAGHTIITGMTGQGKTVLLGILLAQAAKFRPSVVVFDKDRGMQGTVMAMGGRYFPLAMGQPTGMNPLQLDPTPENVIFLKALIRQLAESSGDTVNHNDEVEISRALETVMFRLDRPLRRFSLLLQNLPNPMPDPNDPNPRPTVHARLLKWSEGGEYGWLFDNDTDDIDLTKHRLYGFDYTDFLDVPIIRTPMMMYLMHRTDAMVNGQPFIKVMDEFWKPLEDQFFTKWSKDGLKTIRKANGLLVFATQEPGDALESPIARTIIQQCATQIFLPNPMATRADYVEGFKLTDAEFDLVKSMPADSRKFVIKQGGNCAVGTLNLVGFSDELLVLSCSPDRAEVIEAVIADVGDDPDRWVPAFVSRVKSKEKPL
ncbi:VirB4 family type IV secretion/conjugal transfer ATPase [Xanthomonas campestris pv. raphani]|uniref:VirB4 family type IV secretion/conjugal transfer ATPase n=1 Tax=Xanthomonas TaxID=338 RepID=UPI001E374D49|nr:VirB4 family type IV secretion/conjugal transfer ATPase [Xanthomonas campestris]MCC5091133.1 VirB4 family type IV secretion/conjugal transfer ATPase [Xanthomonas campestris]MEA9752918.1 VirB4 family type IV secretion/conjugal transfer ATPase [Xanthomonas campestris pv. raphani]MEA9813200.1 VirB4 family type IV secretion/conjugal transfer ATPase [Xanthomonas campestris pv. raphani]WDJ08188.1 VirB4 family type IV secretion/conjugal transfer ATPase [Xanthomonas campestris pv. incanae]WDJ87401.